MTRGITIGTVLGVPRGRFLVSRSTGDLLQKSRGTIAAPPQVVALEGSKNLNPLERYGHSTYWSGTFLSTESNC